MGQSDISFEEACRAYGWNTEDGLEIFKKEFNRRVNNSYGNFIMTTLIDEALEDQKNRGAEINKNRALIPVLPLLCHYANCYPTEIDPKTNISLPSSPLSDLFTADSGNTTGISMNGTADRDLANSVRPRAPAQIVKVLIVLGVYFMQ